MAIMDINTIQILIAMVFYMAVVIGIGALYAKRTNKAGAIAGMVGGAGMVFLWKLVISQLGGAFAIYELLPAFIFSAICIVVVSLVTKAPSKEILDDFEAVCTGKNDVA